MALVANDHVDTTLGEHLANIIEAAAWQPDVMREILGACDDARLVVRRKPHRLSFVELGVLKSSQPQQAIPKPGIQAFFGDIDLIAQDKFQR